NTFTRANLYLSAIDRPVLRGNRFVDGKGLGFGYAPGSPVWLGQIADLSEVEANRASGTAPQRVLQFASSGVRGTWTLGPASVAVYVLADVTVESGGTMQVLDGALLKNAGDVRVLAGGTLTATGARVTAVGDDSVGGNSDGDNGSSSWPGFDVLSGAAATISGSTFTRAAVALDVNGDWFTAGGDADVSATGSQFSENAFDIANGPKDEVGAVDAGGSFALLISTHEHGCTRPAPNQDFYTRTLVDVEGTGRQDDPPCKPGYVESDSH
ncbi:MAG TPA: hypothetical protein VFR07_06380, partial [Mycobacteriales bacterium]|nr:hypothetical protein [Mycobacteriales bacterium]